MSIFKITAAAGVLALTASQAMAWGDMYMGDNAENNPNSMSPPAAHVQNFCPAGLQPVSVGGVICCGTPGNNMSMLYGD